jgi:hypothetical protein
VSRLSSGRIPSTLTAATATAAATLVLVLALMAALPGGALAAIGAPAVALTPASAAAASTANLGIDLKFTPSSGDTVKDLALQLPAGLVANAAVNGGACLKAAAPSAACQVGSGTVTASGVTLQTVYDLVAPPKAGDLAGVQLLANGSPLGGPGDVTVRPTGDPAGVGLDIAFSNIPNTFPLIGTLAVPISVTDINSTFDGLRFPARCPATPARIVVAADSYSDSSLQSGSAPLSVTGCGSLPYSPAFSVTATRDSGDQGVAVTTDVTQTANQATSGSVSLAFPGTTLSPNVTAVEGLCANLASGTCTPVGSASSVSPLYPTPLTGKAYLTGSLSALGLTIVFPPPFALTLTGQVDLGHNSTTFAGLPDIPLTDLKVTLNGGPGAVFQSSCSTPSGTASATLTSQNGDQTKTVSTPYTVSRCTKPSSGGGGGGKTTSGKPPRLEGTSFSGLTTRKPTLLFQLVAGRGAPSLSAFTVELPRGLSFARHRVHGVLRLSGVSLVGAKLKSATLKKGQLTVTLRKAVGSVIVSISAKGLAESGGLKSQATRHKLKSLKLVVLAKDAKAKTTKLSAQVKNLHLKK